MWSPACIEEAIDFASQHELNALVLHENSIMHETTFPRRYFDDAQRTGYAHVRRYLSGIYSKQAYVRDVLKRAARRGIAVWVEVKELEFPDEILEKFPQLWKDGNICPTEPVWKEYLSIKTEEFFEVFPSMAGIILSPGSPESRAFLSAGRKCSCDRCRATDFRDWCYDIVMSMYAPMRNLGKELVVRDFVYTPEDHQRIADLMERLPPEIGFSLKATARDFWPTFPDNVLIVRTSGRRKWIEYDVFGQFYGWGVCPSIMTDDIRERFDHAQTHGVSGVLLRSEWEGVRVSSFDTVNMLNLIAAAGWAKDPGSPVERFVQQWLEAFCATAGESAPANPDLSALVGFLRDTWPLMRKTIYVDGFVFATSSQFPLDVTKAWFTMSFYHCLSTWDPSAEGRIDLKAVNVRRLLREKDEAIREVDALCSHLEANTFGLPPSCHAALREQFQFYPLYVRGFSLCTKVVLLAKALEHDGNEPAQLEEFSEELAGLLDKLGVYVAELQRFEDTTDHPFYVYLLLNYRFAEGIRSEAARKLDHYHERR